MKTRGAFIMMMLGGVSLSAFAQDHEVSLDCFIREDDTTVTLHGSWCGGDKLELVKDGVVFMAYTHDILPHGKIRLSAKIDSGAERTKFQLRSYVGNTFKCSRAVYVVKYKMLMNSGSAKKSDKA